jgi:excinuclease ABC subunit C
MLSERVTEHTVPESLLARLKLNLAGVQCWPTASRLETALLMHALAKRHFPEDYLTKLRLRMPWFITLTVEDAFPRLALTNRIPSRAAALFGPFLTRDLAQEYEQSILGLFQIRRCFESLIPTPEHPGCIYGEMSQCLRPCQSAVTSDEYLSEAARVRDFLSTNGKAATGALLVARDRAAAATDFEQAAYLHKRLERVKDAASRRDPVIGEIGQFSGVALTRGLAPREFQLWPMLQGYWQEPLTLDFSTEHTRATSLDQQLREKLSVALAAPSHDGSRLEELAIFSRWYYSSWRDGEWFPFRTLADLNYRKLVREISKMVKDNAEAPIHPASC